MPLPSGGKYRSLCNLRFHLHGAIEAVKGVELVHVQQIEAGKEPHPLTIAHLRIHSVITQDSPQRLLLGCLFFAYRKRRCAGYVLSMSSRSHPVCELNDAFSITARHASPDLEFLWILLSPHNIIPRSLY